MMPADADIPKAGRCRAREGPQESETMGWFKDKFAAEPIECPRGWGQVSFVLQVFFFPVFFMMDRRCPIGGVEECTKCRHPVNPGLTEHLRLQLEELNGLRGSVLSEEEFRIRRRLIVEAQDPHHGIPGRDAAIAALVLGPLGVVAIGAGWYFSSGVHVLGVPGVRGVGLVLAARAAGCTGISMIKRRTLPNPDDPLFEEFRDDTSELEAELGRAREELGFFRELHEGESRGRLRPPDADDSG